MTREYGMAYYDPAARVSRITPERARIMARALDAGVPSELLAREYNTTASAVNRAVLRYRKWKGER